MNFVGVDGCRSGWFWVCLTESRAWDANVERDLAHLWARWQRADVILIDIPIGLLESRHGERLCDREARRVLGRPRSSSVFPVPCRPALYARGYAEACRINERHTGRRLSRQTWNIAGKIREAEELLRSSPRARHVVREIHPEVLFWALNRGRSMVHNKRTEGGFEERLQLLERRYPGSRGIAASALDKFTRKAVRRDDVVDALAAAITGKLGRESLWSFPEHPERDAIGLPMEIVCYRR